MEESKQTSYEFNSYCDRYSITTGGLGCGLWDDYDYDQVKDLLEDPMGNNQQLRQLSRRVYNQNGIVTNTIDYMVALPTLDYVIVPKGKNKAKLKKSKELVQRVLKKIRHKEFVRDVLFKGMVDGISFYYMDTSSPVYSNETALTDYEVERIIEANEADVNVAMKPLPVDYTKIVGIKNGSYVLAFNLKYFTDYTGDKLERKLRKYPKEIREKYYEWDKSNRQGAQWIILDNKKTHAFKIRSGKEESWGRPLVMAALQDIFYSDYFTDTKRHVLDNVNNKIYYQTFPAGEKPGKSALSEKQQQAQHESIKQAITHKNSRGGISFFSVASGTKLDSLDTDVDILDEKNEANISNNISTSMGFAGSLLSASGTTSYTAQQSNLELVTAEILMFIEAIESELNKCIAYNIVKDNSVSVEVSYLPIMHTNKQKMIDNAKALYLEGSGSISLWAAACGISSDVFFALLDEEIESGVYDKYKPHQTSHTMSAKQSEGGRPQEENPTNPNTVVSKSNGSNNQPKPSNNK